MSEEIDAAKMPPVPRDPKLWEEHFLQVCSVRLSLTLTKEKEQWDADSSEPRERLRPRMIDQFKRLEDILNNPGVPPVKDPYFFHPRMKNFREEISRMISERLH